MSNDQDRQPGSWHLKKEIGVTHIFTTIMVIVSALWWASGIETRMAVSETKIMGFEKSLSKQEDYLIRINEKLDRIIENRSGYRKNGR